MRYCFAPSSVRARPANSPVVGKPCCSSNSAIELQRVSLWVTKSNRGRQPSLKCVR
jgi:hypothetical protein